MSVKEILLLHHSHLDIGYTHTQPIIEELQKDFIDQAITLIDETRDWDDDSKPRWTCEVTWQFKQWLKRSTPDELAKFKGLVDQKRIAIGAMENNSTPLASQEELIRSIQDLDELRELTGAPMRVAFQHDVTGIPWAMTDLLLDSGVELLVMSINLHTSLDGPGDRPNVFRWETPSGRELLVMNAHHYSSFDQILNVQELSTDIMAESFAKYEKDVLEARNYSHDFLFLSSTNVPVMYDNGQPNRITAELVREFNAKNKGPRVRYVTPEMLLDRIRKIPGDQFAKYRGDWTDFWNYGSTSTSWETALNSKAKTKLKTAEMLTAMQPISKKNKMIINEAWEQIKLYDEHTWTSADSTYYNDECRMQTNIKSGRAIRAHELAGYTLINQMEEVTKNEPSYVEAKGIFIANPTSRVIKQMCPIPKQWSEKEIWGRVLMYRHWFSDVTMVNDIPREKDLKYLEVELPPYSWKKIPLSNVMDYKESDDLKTASLEEEILVKALDNDSGKKRVSGVRYIESPYHILSYNPQNGRIVSILDKKTDWHILPENSDYDFFELIHEEPCRRFDNTRKSYYDRDAVAEMRFQSCWNKDWRRSYNGIDELVSIEVVEEDGSICLKRIMTLKGMSKVEHKIRLFLEKPYIEVKVEFYKEVVTDPEAVYLVTQLNLPSGWDAHYDTGSVPVALDADQLDGCSHGWITSNNYAAMHNENNCAVIFNAEAPLVQIGDFNFGHTESIVKRQDNPLMVAWPIGNYWETNFPLSQPGKITLRYGFQTFEGFDPAIVSKEAEVFSHGLYVHPIAECSEMSCGTLVDIDNDQVKIEYISCDSNNDVLIRLINLSKGEEKAQLKWHVSKIKEAEIVTPQEKVLETISPVSDGVFAVNLLARQVISIRLKVDKDH